MQEGSKRKITKRGDHPRKDRTEYTQKVTEKAELIRRL
jgi:hypothetical protein